jgi:hypothetical protein
MPLSEVLLMSSVVTAVGLVFVWWFLKIEGVWAWLRWRLVGDRCPWCHRSPGQPGRIVINTISGISQLPCHHRCHRERER